MFLPALIAARRLLWFSALIALLLAELAVARSRFFFAAAALRDSFCLPIRIISQLFTVI
jgi:hypothetical protein